MSRTEFLEKLREALDQNVSPHVVRENVEYYGRYINEEMRKGRSEQEILEELGDPWVIAKTIIDSEEAKNGGEYIYESNSGYGAAGGAGKDYSTNQVKVFRFDTWWKKLLLVRVVVGIICVVVSIITGLVSLIAPVVIPILIIMLLIKLIKGSKE